MKNLNYHIGQQDQANWLIGEEVFDGRYLGKCEAIFCQGNGYLGVRHALEEPYTGETRDMFVTGTFNKFHEDEVTELPNFPDLTKMVFMLNGRPFSLEQGKVLTYRRVMNLKTGEVVRTVEWEDLAGDAFRFTFRRMVSMADEHVIAAKVTIEPLTADVNLKFLSGIDGTVSNSGAQHFCEGEKRLYDYKYIEMVSKTVESGVTAGLYTTHRFYNDKGDVSCTLLPIISRRVIKISAQTTIAKGESLTIEKLSCVYTSRDLAFDGMTDAALVTEQVKQAGQTRIRELLDTGYDALMAQSASAWEKIWEREDVQIASRAPFDQLAIRFAIYHLNIMVKRNDPRVGIGAKALTGEGYKGHSFWDTEVFILPYFLMTEPSTARTLLEYRYKNLYGARQKAKEYGYQGAMYPWEAAWTTDGEVTPIWGPADVVTGKPMQYLTGMIEQHISADVAFAVWQYYMATRDQDFMDRCGYEIILDTARFWASRLEWKEDKNRYEITDVIGPDEYKEHVNNNAYTNYLACYNMKLARQILAKLPEENPALYQALSDKLSLEGLDAVLEERIAHMYLPAPREADGIIAQFEGYFDLKYLDLTKYKESTEVLTIYNDFSPEQINHYQVSKQGDLVVLFYLLEDLFPEEIKRKNYLFYEERTLHDSSLSKCTHGVVANDLGMHEEAYHFYQGASRVDLGEEMKSSDAGIHSAAMGGIWQVAVLGFGGVRVCGGQLRIHPAIPDEWDSLSFRVVWMGSGLRIRVLRDQVEITNEGDAVSVVLYGEEVTIGKGETLARSTANCR